MKNLQGKVAFVTGGSSGIGQGIVKVLADEGMKVAFSYRRQDHLEQTTYGDWDWIMSVNVGGVINALVTFLPSMVASGQEAHIVNVASMGGIAALGAVGLYTTTKYAVVGLSESLRTDMIGRNIGVSVYCPGTVKSNIGEGDTMRHERFKDTGYAPGERRKEGETSFMDLAMDAVEAGGHVLKGIKDNQLFIISHPEYRDVLRARQAKIEASITNETIDEARAESVRFILSNAIYSENA
jgi:NAD(P)-dependent dehydrogenase (short-subunit alcohol dehydrogenase family)